MSARQRVITNASANLVALGLGAIVQIVQVPVFTAVWSLEKYGTWLLLSAIASYFALTDLGFSAAAQSEMTMYHVRNEHGRTQAVYQSTWVLMVLLSGLVVAATAALIGCAQILAHQGVSVPRFLLLHGWTIVLFILYMVLNILSRVVLSGFRATGLYAFGSFAYELSTFFESFLIMGVAWFGGSFDACVLSGIVSRVAWTFAGDWYLVSKQEHMRLGWTYASRAELRRLLHPALAAMAMPISTALTMNGGTILVGYLVSTIAVASMTPVRTMSRVGLQLVSSITRGSMPEVSRAAHAATPRPLRKLLVGNLVLSATLLVVGAIIFSLIGERAVSLWTHGKIVAPQFLVILLALDMVAQGLWSLGSNLLLATNEHTAIAPAVLLISFLTLVAAWPAGACFGLFGVVAATVVGDTVILVAVGLIFRNSRLHQAAFRAETFAG